MNRTRSIIRDTSFLFYMAPLMYFAFYGFWKLHFYGLEAENLLMGCQKVYKTSCYITYLSHTPHFVSSLKHFIISHQYKKEEYNIIKYFERERSHSYNFHCSIVIIVLFHSYCLFLTLFYQLNLIKGMYYRK